ncbi:MAG: VWA domain-containing protein [Rhodothermus sp.]|nr:VWA domain-containing protein [Rhodothermus sp.]
MDRRGDITARIVAFAQALRRAGLVIGTDQVLDALRAVELVGVVQREDVRQALFSVFVRRQSEAVLFHQVFQLFWQGRMPLPEELAALLPRAPVSPTPPPGMARALEALRSDRSRPDSSAAEEQEVELVLTYSADEVLRHKDFAQMTAEEEAAVRAFLRTLRWPMPPRRTRRWQPGGRRGRPDLRRTLRQALRRQGEVLHLAMRLPRYKSRVLVALCDISGSMERYSRLLLHFLHAITGGLRRVESFVFGTRLTRITHQLRLRDVDVALAEVGRTVQDWSGGTRIGEALRAFNYRWLRRVLPASGVVLIISDGLDRGDPELLTREIARLQRSCYRLIWLNPLLRYAHYQPLTRGMRAALPYIDHFLPVHNLTSLEQLGQLLASLDAPRPGTVVAR